MFYLDKDVNVYEPQPCIKKEYDTFYIFTEQCDLAEQ